MFGSKSFLCADFGAGTLKLAEFQITEAETLKLKQFSVRSLGSDARQESKREAAISRAFVEWVAEAGLQGKELHLSVSGFQTFSRFIKLPAVESAKVAQMVQFEAQQNVPFPLEEVVWDYQVVGTLPTGEVQVWLVAMKSEPVEGIFRTVEAAGPRLSLVDASQMALCNAFRFNYADLEGCSMLLNIGARTTDVLFIEKGQCYVRTINLGSQMITQEFAAETKVPFERAEETKLNCGFVSLGGAFEEPADPKEAALAKIARQFFTRLHSQIHQTMQQYRAQQGGSAPQRLFLSGGGSMLAFTDQFFAEKLGLPVCYFNPFRNVEIEPGLEIEELSKLAPVLGEIVGLGLRKLAQCPLEVDLIPKSVRKRQEFDQKKPYFIASVLSTVLMLLIYGVFFQRLAMIRKNAVAELDAKFKPLQAKYNQLKTHLDSISKSQQEMAQLGEYLRERPFWGDLLTDVGRTLYETENQASQAGQPVGVWIEKFGKMDEVEQTEEVVQEAGPMMLMDQRYADRHRIAIKPSLLPLTNILESIPANLRALNMNVPGAKSANGALAYFVEGRFQSRTNFFVPQGTKLTGKLEDVPPSSETFRFGMTYQLKDPLKL